MNTAPNLYSALATAVLFLHALFMVWVVFGTVVTRSRPILCWLHIVSLIWGILTELLPLALSINAPRELSGTKSGRRAVPGRLPASLYGQAGLSGHFRNRVDRGGSARLRLQLGDLR
jgi:hypothetical protein